MKLPLSLRSTLLAVLVGLFSALPGARGEAMLQYFNTDWRELTARLPELAEVGYTSLWVPPPTKGSGGLTVGYDLWDRFDLGGKDQRGTVRTRYGTEADLQVLIETAHRCGIRVYFDNVMNHNAFDVPGFNASTPIDVYPGFVPEDFHLRITEDGFYRKWDNTRDWNSAWQVQNLGLADLIDIAIETPNTNHGRSEGDDMPKLTFVRQPANPEYYLDLDLPIPVTNTGGTFNTFTFANKEPWQDFGVAGVPGSAGNGRFDFADTNANGQHDPSEASEPFTDLGVDGTNPARQTAAWGFGDGRYNMGNPVAEDVNALLIRSARWILDRTKADGYRLDAVKHVPDYFFGQQSGADKDRSGAGYLGQSQEQFNLSRGFSDWNNHRDSVFNTEQGRDDAMMFGEHLGIPPGYGGYWDAGMRLVDNDLRSNLNNRLGSPGNGLAGYDQPGWGGFAAALGVTHAQSHDNDFAARRELQHAYYLTRAGFPIIYTDGNNHAGTLSQSGGAFPRLANTNFLGQYGDARIPNMVYIHNHFARGRAELKVFDPNERILNREQIARFSDTDYVAYERLDKRENLNMTDADAAVLLFMMNDNYASGQARSFATSFAGGSYLYNYSSYGGGFYKYADQMHTAVVPPGGYFAFSWRSPEEAGVNSSTGLRPLTILQGGSATATMTYERKDGRDGDKNFNPNGLPDTDATDYKYSITVPRVTSGANLSFIARADGSAENILLALDGGVDLNSHVPLGPTTGEKRDNPPALATDTFLGYEQMQFVRRVAEKFAAVAVSRNIIGSPGAETYRCTIGTAGFTNHNGGGTNSSTGTAAFVYHDPAASRDIGGAQFSPAPASAAGAAITVRVKTGYQFQINQVWLYYTTDGSAPEGSGGMPRGAALALPMAYTEHGLPDGSNITDWWAATLPALGTGTVLRYKVGGLNNVTASVFPGGPAEAELKKRMETVFQIAGFNATTARVRPHNDYSEERTGLAEGFHILRARAFLQRPGKASIYNTWTQTFYYDTQTPGGEIRFPAANGDTVGGQQYGVAVRADPSVTEVWYHIEDGDPTNNDSATGVQAGNGSGPEPFTDRNKNGVRDGSEPFTDINGNGGFDANLAETWVKVGEVSATAAIAGPYGREWRFNYRNIPASGTATITVRLLEVSSSRNLGLSAAAANVTELTRTVITAGSPLRLFAAYPAQDDEAVAEGYIVKVRFTDSLADGLTETQLRNRFIVRIASSESGSLARAVVQSAQTLPILYNVAPGFHDFQFALPNFYNGLPEFLHTLEFTLNRPSPDPDLVTTRQVRAEVTQPAVFLSINNPPEIDSDGKKHEIILPKVAAPTAEQRSSVIEVETGIEAESVALTFTTGSATTALVPPGAVALSGTVAVSGGSTTVTGTGTQFTTQLAASHLLRIGATTSTVAAVLSDTSLTLSAGYGGSTASGATAERIDPNPSISGNHKFWRFLWSGMTPGAFSFRADVQADGDPEPEATATRNVAVIFRESVPLSDTDADDDDDGLGDFGEGTVTLLPTTNSETWTNGEVHVHFAYGNSSPLSPDTDGDGLPDGLEVGWRAAPNPPTLPATDTDGDGFPNFIGDLDPPFYNTTDNVGKVPGVNTIAEGGDRAALKGGSVTDPNNPDTDGDGLGDGIEDANRNGWVDGDGAALPTTFIPFPGRAWPNNKIGPGETWLETSPTKADSDEDGLSDGFGEDKNFNGRIDGDTNNNRSHDSGELWTETDPLKADTDGDGLPDGWEAGHGLDPLDNGTLSLRTGGAGHPANGAGGNPDGDTIVVEGNTIAYTNALEFANSTDPNKADDGPAPPAGSIVIGPQAPVTVGAVTNVKEFTDWTYQDLIALDEYDGDGPNYQQADVYQANDGFDASRDIVAFYARDGGDTGTGGDGNFYFRVDVRDLAPFAEDGRLDLYVVVDTGNPGAGEYALPDEVDLGTEMKWEAVVAVYSGNNGRVYVDTQNTNNSISIVQNPANFGVVARDQNAADGFKKAHFSADLDAIEFSISRKALRDAGWNGFNANQLNYQVFTTRDGTGNSPIGPGDIGGRNDLRDTIGDDFLASDYYADQNYISQPANAELRAYFGLTPPAISHRGKRAKVMTVIHGNQALQPGYTTQALINTAAGGGSYRPLDVHQAYAAPAALHLTPTLASSIEWARVDPASPRPYRDGPAFNARIKALAQAGVLDLLGSTFADHVVSYFHSDFNAANVNLADDFLTHFYGNTHSARVFWNPQRVADAGTFAQIAGLGFDHTFIDQMRHVQKWFGRNSALGDDGYRINQVNGVKCFVINDQASGYRFLNTGNGLALPLRDLLQRKARSNTQDQVVVLFSPWEDFSSKTNADAYDRNLRWLASHPWTQLVTPDQIAAGEIDLSLPPNGTGDAWGVINRGNGAGLPKVAHDFIDHATQESYDNWYNGQPGREEGLRDKRFHLRTGVQLPAGRNFGTLTLGTGIVSETWTLASTVVAPGLEALAHGTAGAAVFETAFHNQTNNDLSKFSTGAYIFPDVSAQNLAGFAKVAQSQFRNAAVYRRVDLWVAAANAGTYQAAATAESSDVDLDGELEYALFNDRVFALFERIGGRLTGAWVRNLGTGAVQQAIGNPLSYAGSEDESEGNVNPSATVAGAYRTSGFKDWFATGAPDALSYVNNLYGAAPAPSGTGWTFTSSDGRIAKTITLAPGATLLRASYALSGGVGPLYVRFGLSPNLHDLLLSGQKNLTPLVNLPANGEAGVTNLVSGAPVRTFIRYGGAGNTGSLQATAVDKDAAAGFDTINLRAQAQTQQVEIFGTNGLTFALGLQAGATITQDTDGDTLADWWETQYGFDPASNAGVNGANGDIDGDGLTNAQEFAFGTNPLVNDAHSTQLRITKPAANQRRLYFQTRPDRAYRIYYTNDLLMPFTAVVPDLPGTGAELEWIDDGTLTGTAPSAESDRFYKVEARLPQPE